MYKLDVSSQGSTNLTCEVNIESHYFEDGNVQLHSKKEKTVPIAVGDAKATARAIGSAINDFEATFQNSLEELYVNMHRTTFKSMRRFYPPNGTFITWNINAHNVANTVGR